MGWGKRSYFKRLAESLLGGESCPRHSWHTWGRLRRKESWRRDSSDKSSSATGLLFPHSSGKTHLSIALGSDLPDSKYHPVKITGTLCSSSDQPQSKAWLRYEMSPTGSCVPCSVPICGIIWEGDRSSGRKKFMGRMPSKVAHGPCASSLCYLFSVW